MKTTRRAVLTSAAAGSAAFLAHGWVDPAHALVAAGVTPFSAPLPTLSELGLIDLRGGGSAVLDMVNTQHRFHPAMGPTRTLAYRRPGTSQTYLGPVVVAQRGVPVSITVTNRLGAHPLGFAVDPALVPSGTTIDARSPRTAMHLHGGNVATQHDGGPLETFKPGTSFTYRYANSQESAGLWYHDHALGITRLNVYAGLAGGYLIRDVNDPGDGSRLPAPPYEVPLILQDRMFNSDGTFAYPPNPGVNRPWAPEFFGDVATVNGKAWPRMQVHRGKYRFRVYNGSNARFYDLKLMLPSEAAMTFWQIGTDGGLLDAPVPMNRLLLGPGERADLVVDFANLPAGTKVTVRNSAPTPYPNGRRGSVNVPLASVMRFDVVATSGWTRALPANLRAGTAPVTRLARSVPEKVRTMTLVEIMDPQLGVPKMALLNNRSFMDGTDYADQPIRSNALERWDLVNLTGDAHPIHLHFTQFQVLNRQRVDVARYQEAVYGTGPLVENTGPYPPDSAVPLAPYLSGSAQAAPANERGWKDTVVCPPGVVTRILVPFGANPRGVVGAMAIGASYTGDYVWHCHILEHEDNDMMQRFRIAP